MKQLYRQIKNYCKDKSIDGWIVFLLAVYLVLIIKLVAFQELNQSLLFGAYSLTVSFYILSRFAISFFYEHERSPNKLKELPTASFGIPSKNEEENIKETILKIANCDYPKDKFDIIAINDGSTDKTLERMFKAKAEAARIGVKVKIINWKINRGKREGMTECINQSDKDIVIFIDSDSFVEKDTAQELVKYFVDDKIAAVAGHAYAANAEVNVLTKMQAVRYFVAFRSYKAAESIFGSVTCCSGCCSAYRRIYVLGVLNAWRNQTFLGIRCTYGDDRSLTNFLLQKGYKCLYAPKAIVHTVVPDTMRKFMRQQLRWKKSWVRESMKAATFIWKRHPAMSIAFYMGVILPLLAPLVVLRALIWYPFTTHHFPYYYLAGLTLMAFIYGIYYYIHTRDRKWVFGVLFATFYTLILIWQLPYAILNLRDSRWGTR